MCCNQAPKAQYQDLVISPAKQSLKICLMGDMSVGKSTLAHRLVGQESWKSTPTIVVDVHRTELELDNGTIIPINLWDTAGQERFGASAVISSTLRGADAVILVYDLISLDSLHNLMYTWFPLVQRHSPGMQEVLVVGNKLDLMENQGTSENEAQMESLLGSFCELLKENKLRFTLVRFSALKAEQVSCAEVFLAFVRRTTFSNPELLVWE